LRNTIKISFVLFLALISVIRLNAQNTLPKYFHFSQTSDETPLPPSNSVSQMAIQESIIWIGTSKGLSKSTNFAKSWINYNKVPQFANEGIYALYF
jgi:hypothetical protein